MRFKIKKDWLWTHQVQVLCYILSLFSEQFLHLLAVRILPKLEPDFPFLPHVPQSQEEDRWIVLPTTASKLFFLLSPSVSLTSFKCIISGFTPLSLLLLLPTPPSLMTFHHCFWHLCVTTSHNSFVQCSSLLWYSQLLFSAISTSRPHGYNLDLIVIIILEMCDLCV